MVDFHTHILPMFDDGARSIEETLELIKEAKEAGFSDILLTTHYIKGIYNSKKEEREKVISKLEEILKKKQINLNLYPANEIYITDDIVELIQNNIINSINNTKYVLFELPLNAKPFNLYDVVYKLLKYKYIPILAHPERYSFIGKNLDIVYELIQNGVLMQSNYGSIIGNYGKRAKAIIKILLKNNMVHFLGTDVHRENTIYPKMQEILKEIEEIIGKEKLHTITDVNPKLVLKNENIKIQEPEKIKLSIKDKIILK